MSTTMQEPPSATDNAITLDHRETTAQAEVIDQVHPENGMLLVRFTPLSQSILLATDANKRGKEDDAVQWHVEIVKAAKDFWSAPTGKRFPVPYKVGQRVMIQPGSVHVCPGYAGWKHLGIVFYEHVTAVVGEAPEAPAPKKRGRKAKVSPPEANEPQVTSPDSSIVTP